MRFKLQRRWVLSVILTASFIPSIYFSYVAASIPFRDNINYSNFYDSLKSLGFLTGYASYFAQTGASEPISYLIFYTLEYCKLSYPSAIIVKNLVITYLIVSFFSARLKSFSLSLFLSFYIVSDYYFLRLLGELHRLSFAFLFLLLIAKNFRLVGAKVVLSILTHFQFIMLLPAVPFTSRRARRSFVFLSPFLVFALFFVRERIWNKIVYYFNLSGIDLMNFALVSCVFAFLILSTGSRKTLKFWLGVTFLFGVIVAVLGTGRTLIVYWEILIFIIFSVAFNRPPSQRNMPFFGVALLMLISYNTLRYIGFIRELGIL